MAKKVLKISGIVLLVLIVLAFVLPFFFKGKIMAIAREQINKNVNARVDFKDINLSLFRHFPRLAVGLENLQVIGTDAFSKDTLIAARQIDVAVNLFSLFGGSEMKISSITIDEPRIHAIVHADGKANWDISKPDTSTAVSTDTTAFHFSLQSYKINDGYISYIDIPGDMSSEITHLNHSGSGDFTSDLFTLKTKTAAESVSFTYSKIPYLMNAKTELDADIEVDNKSNKYSFKTDEISLNDLKLSANGYFQFVNDTTYGMDIQFSAPSTEFKTLLSLVPAVYKNDFNKIKTSGKAVFNGFVKGEYNSIKIPAYQVNLNVENGFFQYPDLPQPVKNINIALKVDNPDGVTDHTVVDISKGHIEFGADPFDFRLLLKNPVTDQYIDAIIKGKLNLAQVTQFVKLSGDTKLSGLLNADASAKGNVSAITHQKPGPFTANGFINITDLNYSSKDFPQPIRNSNVQIAFTNPDGLADHTVINVPAAHVEIGSDPVDFNLLIKTPLSNLYFEGRAKGKFNLANAAQFTTLEPGTSLSGTLAADVSFKGNKSSIDKKEYDKINTSGTLNLAGLSYASKAYPDGIKVEEAAFTFNPKNITLNTARATFQQTHYTASGSVDNAIGYALKDEPIAGNLNVQADNIDLNKLMGTASDSSEAQNKSTASAEPFKVPSNVAFIINAAVDKLHYDKVDYSNLKGSIAIKDETVALKDVQMNALDGKISATGFYSTKNNKKNPDISFTYNVSGLDVQKTFNAFNTVQKLMPAGKFVDGKVNSQLTLNGKLDGNMMPELGSLTGKGTLDMVEGVFKKFAPVEKLAQTLNVNDLNGISLKDVKFSFEFANGKVLVQPFHVKVKDIDMQIGGTQGFDQSIDYLIGMKLPRSIIGSQGNALINNLAQQANSKGIPVKLSDNINLSVRMGGTLTNPQLKTGLNETGGDVTSAIKQQAADFAKQAVDSVKTVAAAKTNELKDSAKAIKNQAVKDLTSDLGKALSGQKDSTGSGKTLENTQKNAEKTLKNTLNNLFNKKSTGKDTTKTK